MGWSYSFFGVFLTDLSIQYVMTLHDNKDEGVFIGM